eukprot:TRINITY_DN44154_c0_g2_i1.p1 TRINITY_DN44154_c0_g2~~TRINITY_DN44154_c0_g2_i1.p1  ORF type:complete len:712 (-),score=67.54 TRINITY_DN44154_c0_g2_i1:28-2163(-)
MPVSCDEPRGEDPMGDNVQRAPESPEMEAGAASPPRRQRRHSKRWHAYCWCGGIALIGAASVIAIVLAIPKHAGGASPSPAPPKPPNDDYQPLFCLSSHFASSDENGRLRHFSVWAPHAESVVLVPKTSNTSWASTSMTLAANGTWKVDVEEVRAGDGYAFRIDDVDRIDPCALDISEDGSFSVVPAAYAWRTARKVIARGEAVLYELHVGSFTENGTLYSAAERLPHLAKLGVTVIQLMPVMYFGGNPRAWGYNPGAPYAVKPELGGSEGLRAFVDAAAEFGMAVGVDTIFNHLSDDNLLTKYDGWDVVNGIYFYTDNKSYATGFSRYGPRPNYANASVSSYIIDNYLMWVDEFHIGAFRWDATMCIRKGVGDQSCFAEPHEESEIPEGWRLMQLAINASSTGSRHGSLHWAEDLNTAKSGPARPFYDLMKTMSAPRVGPAAAPGGAGFSAQWLFPFDMQAEFNKKISMIDVRRITESCVSMNFTRVLYSESHDTASEQNPTTPGRIPSMLERQGLDAFLVRKLTMLFTGLVFTCPAVPMLLQGQEFSTLDKFAFPEPPILDWTLVDENAGFLREVEHLIALRTNKKGATPALTSDVSSVMMITGQIAAMVRHSQDQAAPGSETVVIYNFGQERHLYAEIPAWPSDGTWYVHFNGDSKHYSQTHADECSHQVLVKVVNRQAIVCVPMLSILIFSQVAGKSGPENSVVISA